VTVRNRGKTPALFVALDLDSADARRYHVSDSGFTLLPGETKELEVTEFLSASQQTDAPPIRLQAKAWNSSKVSTAWEAKP
jgi:hypothetical protein